MRFGYLELGKPEKGLMLKFLRKVSGYSDIQVKRFVRQYFETGRVRLRKAKKRGFIRKYTDADIRLLATTDELHGTLSGTGTYRRVRTHFTKTRPRPSIIGERRKPRPNGKPDYIRVDTVHQGDQDGMKGNLASTERSSMQLLFDKVAKLNIGWNERPLTEADLETLCQRLGVEIDETPMTVDGFYFRLMERGFIAVNSQLGKMERLAVLFHEIGHLLFNAPTSGPAAWFHHVGLKTRQEIEADVFSLCAIIPRTWVETRSAEELIGDEGLSAEMVGERLRCSRFTGSDGRGSISLAWGFYLFIGGQASGTLALQVVI